MLIKKTKSVILYLIFICFIHSYSQELSEPEKNFEHLWKEFDTRYAIFIPKRVDWDLLYKIYRPKVTHQTTDDELFDIMSKMLGHLNDNHVRLATADRSRSFSAGILEDLRKDKFSGSDEAMRFFRQRPVNEKYIFGGYEERMNGRFAFGFVDENIGYFHFSGFRNVTESAAVTDEIVEKFKDARGIIIDVRRNGGGDDRVGKTIADRFADKKRLYMVTQIRDGEEHDDFSNTLYWYVEPGGKRQFTKPVILLINRYSISAADNFALAMRVLPHAVLVGDFTSGCFADVAGDRLPNGWSFGVSYKLFVDQDGFCWEGIGVPPDYRILNYDEDFKTGRDRVLEFAIEMINSGAMKKRPDMPEFPIK